MKKSILVIMMTAVAALALTACGGGSGEKKVAEVSDADKAGAKELTINATNWKFDKNEYKVEKGQTYKLVLNSKDGVHSAKISGLGIELTTNEPEQYVKFDDADTFTIQCNVPCGAGHLDMKSKLVVE